MPRRPRAGLIDSASMAILEVLRATREKAVR